MVLHVRRLVTGYAVRRLLVNAAAIEGRHGLGDDELRARVLRRKIGPDLVVIIVAQEVQRAGMEDGILRAAVIGGLCDGPRGIEGAHYSGELARNRSGGAVCIGSMLHYFVAAAPDEKAGVIPGAQQHFRQMADVSRVPNEAGVLPRPRF